MFIYISETWYAGSNQVLEILCEFGFREIRCDDAGDIMEISNYVTKHYNENLVMRGELTLEDLEILEKRPFFVHLALDAAISLRFERYKATHLGADLEQFVARHDSRIAERTYKPQLWDRAHIKIFISRKADFERRLVEELRGILTVAAHGKNFRDASHTTTPLRPDWDAYFMKLATLAASRSNCMKRRVGCVVVRECRVIATGYNGTPRHLVNCHAGGCPRCNNGDVQLSTCLCLHAEENALLEAGRDRVGVNAILYCDTCPCLTCSVKIVQTGIREVVYSKSYNMDEASFKVLQEGGVLVRQLSVPAEPMHIIV
ncbi:LAMI_0H00606g1_1 [Lachancea mirantina]|uniref:Deoxycytidylate deaminase n=1 Tax=Lachancea mirantina TaxID=1230905 RepID=A0A1G4KDL1_9SACH|nr:LAMI_0H00606g1_1 [Lachancea mirantina]